MKFELFFLFICLIFFFGHVNWNIYQKVCNLFKASGKKNTVKSKGAKLSMRLGSAL